MGARFLYFFVIASFLVSCDNDSRKGEAILSENLLGYADPIIGTDGMGHTFPGATTPFGMVQLSPSDDSPGWKWSSGYHYSDSIIKGFAHNHFSGTGLAGMGDILLMPTSGELKTNPGTKENPDGGFRTKFSHEKEQASPGYYAVYLDDYDIKVELTTTPRVGFHKYHFQKDGPKHIILDPSHAINENVVKTSVEIISDTEIIGFKKNKNKACGSRTVYFYAKFSEPFTFYGVTENEEILDGANKSESKVSRAFVSFGQSSINSVEVKVALSYVSLDGAIANYNAEANNKTFEQAHKKARELWREKLSKIQIGGTTDQQKRIFYTAMYHSFIAPNIISDVDGNYVIEGEKFHSGNLVQYSNFSTWDTYRATHPLWSIIDQKANTDFVNVLVSRDTKSDVGLPIWEALGHDNLCMIGYPGITAMAEAVLKHPEGINSSLVFEAVKKTAFQTHKSSVNYGRDNGMRYYLKDFYVPASVGCNVSKTTEYNYHDYSVAKLAKKLGRKEDKKLFSKRSIGYRKLFHPDTKYLWPKDTLGNWAKIDTTSWTDLKTNYVSGNLWAYSAYTPHDMVNAISLHGGKEKYAQWLDGLFATPTELEGDQHVDISGFIGKYAHGDEPGHHMPYLYNYVAQPSKTQERVRQIMAEMYDDTPNGLVNNEDCGQMSSWYIFSALGFYPVSPVDLEYAIGSPLYELATINLENGKQFTVKTINNSEENVYVQALKLNGKEHDKFFISHEEIMNGGTLVFEMGPNPVEN